MVKTITEPRRELPVVAEPDVVVVGGGPAGFIAAAASARAGAETLLIERYGHLGGMATGAHVIFWNSMADGVKQVIFGIPQEAVERSIMLGGVKWRRTNLNPSIDAEVAKTVAQEIVEESGAKMLLHTVAANTIVEGNSVKGVIVENKSGRQAILAKVVVDATGDGDIAAFAGVEYTKSTLPITIMNRVGGVDIERVNRFRQENPDMYNRLIGQLSKTGAFLSPDITRKWRIGSGWGPTTRENVIYCHWASFVERDCTNAEDLTYCEIEGRKRINKAMDFFKTNIPGFEKAFLFDVLPQTGTRRSRLIAGEYTLTIEDVNEQRSFADKIAVCGIRGRKESDDTYEIPYRSLIPKRVDDLIISGRCISIDLEAHVFMRDIGPCMATGQAAGAAAALAVKQGVRPRALIEKISLLQKLLIKQGVYLGQK
jgi:ribulose 1,5-bisphosphate synthetase/thiazole synthase